jgi:hypothetical protein
MEIKSALTHSGLLSFPRHRYIFGDVHRLPAYEAHLANENARMAIEDTRSANERAAEANERAAEAQSKLADLQEGKPHY